MSPAGSAWRRPISSDLGLVIFLNISVESIPNPLSILDVKQPQPVEFLLHGENPVGYSGNIFWILNIKIGFMYLKLSSQIGTYPAIYFLGHKKIACRLFLGIRYK